jgi:hypothetical protein
VFNHEKERLKPSDIGSIPLAFRVLSPPLNHGFFRPPIIDPCEISEDVARLILAHRRLNALARQAFVQR